MSRQLLSRSMFFVAVLAAAACKPNGGSTLQGLEQLSGLDKRNVCEGPVTPGKSALPESAIEVEAGDRAEVFDAVQAAASAVPAGLRDAFLAHGGKIKVVKDAQKVCAELVNANPSLIQLPTTLSDLRGESCLIPQARGLFADATPATLYVDSDPVVIRDRLVRQFAAVYLLYFGSVDSTSSSDAPLRFTEIPAIGEAKRHLTSEYLYDLKGSTLFPISAIDRYLGKGAGDKVMSQMRVALTVGMKELSLEDFAKTDQSPAGNKRAFLSAEQFRVLVLVEAFDQYYCNSVAKVDRDQLSTLAVDAKRSQELGALLQRSRNSRVVMQHLFPRSFRVFLNQWAPLIEALPRFDAESPSVPSQGLALTQPRMTDTQQKSSAYRSKLAAYYQDMQNIAARNAELARAAAIQQIRDRENLDHDPTSDTVRQIDRDKAVALGREYSQINRTLEDAKKWESMPVITAEQLRRLPASVQEEYSAQQARYAEVQTQRAEMEQRQRQIEDEYRLISRARRTEQSAVDDFQRNFPVQGEGMDPARAKAALLRLPDAPIPPSEEQEARDKAASNEEIRKSVSGIQFWQSVAGMAPVVGIGGDGASALTNAYLFYETGEFQDLRNAGVDMINAVPFVGDAFAIGKNGRKAVDAGGQAIDLYRTGANTTKVLKAGAAAVGHTANVGYTYYQIGDLSAGAYDLAEAYLRKEGKINESMSQEEIAFEITRQAYVTQVEEARKQEYQKYKAAACDPTPDGMHLTDTCTTQPEPTTQAADPAGTEGEVATATPSADPTATTGQAPATDLTEVVANEQYVQVSEPAETPEDVQVVEAQTYPEMPTQEVAGTPTDASAEGF